MTEPRRALALVQSLHISGVIIGTLVGFGITAPLYIRLVLSATERPALLGFLIPARKAS